MIINIGQRIEQCPAVECALISPIPTVDDLLKREHRIERIANEILLFLTQTEIIDPISACEALARRIVEADES